MLGSSSCGRRASLSTRVCRSRMIVVLLAWPPQSKSNSESTSNADAKAGALKCAATTACRFLDRGPICGGRLAATEGRGKQRPYGPDFAVSAAIVGSRDVPFGAHARSRRRGTLRSAQDDGPFAFELSVEFRVTVAVGMTMRCGWRTEVRAYDSVSASVAGGALV